ncbi:hypothetical protein [Streptomyces paludis]|uniref:Bacterial Pleckstrin homology domain-containing protein n=1 Tax=Streptomyces paludis TaxID=2282738 RepID=A0A345HLC5_9ACTN|nr:hypothetical protein [Streptomyces paludis]AXG77499.1 hypothetical protein DVK44_07090 [Streptomyces paludis]
MALAETTPAALVIRLEGLRRTFGRRRPLTIPWANVQQVYADERVARAYPGARWGVATHFPGVITLGSFRRAGRRTFWDVRDPARAIVVELSGEKYDRLVLEVADPARTLAAIEGARR